MHPSLEVRRQNQMMAPCTSCEAVSWVDECIRWFDLHPDFLGKRKSLLTRRPLKIKSFFFCGSLRSPPIHPSCRDTGLWSALGTSASTSTND
ncbi:hypothetical protein NCS52_00556000 [Fusarium sp. LHS14.1]|nr:hypothetical protein NCS52_00556000 [Fusarium sp. LHS14.1]